MRRNQMKQYSLRKRIPGKDSEGGSIVTWEPAVAIEATIWSAGGAAQATQYGDRLAYIKNMEYSGDADLKEFDGICVYVDGEHEPDFIIKSINRDVDPKVITLEQRNV